MDETWTQPVTVETMYGDWDFETAVAALDRSLNPRPSIAVLDYIEPLGVGSGDVVLDIGGREGQHAVVMAERFGCRVMCVDPVAANIERGRDLVAAHDHGHMVELRQGSIEQIPADEASFKLVFARDMLGHIADLKLALTECRRVVTPGGRMLIFEVFATPEMYPEELAALCGHTATVPERMSVEDFEDSARAAGFRIATCDIIGSEFVEASQESGTAPNYLVELSRLRRAKDALIEEMGEIPYRVMYGNALWSVYRFLGKLESRIYVLEDAG